MLNFTIYTDGSCHGNGQEGATAGFGCVIKSNQRNGWWELQGPVTGEQTNNRAELTAVIAGTKLAIELANGNPATVTVRTDSAYVTNAVNNRWIHQWAKNQWKTSSNKPVSNVDLWQKVIANCQVIYKLGNAKVMFEHVDGHAGDSNNERADKLANESANKNAQCA